MLKRLCIILLKLICLEFFLLLVIFYLRLGWFLHIVWLVGIVIAFFITRPEWTRTNQKFVYVMFLVIVYIFLSVISLIYIIVGDKSYRTFKMTWANEGANNDFKESEILLGFVEYPGHYEGIYSNELAAYLKQLPGNQVDVTFEVTSNFGCLRGFNETQIGELKSWRSPFGYSRGTDFAEDHPSPWKTPWWCP